MKILEGIRRSGKPLPFKTLEVLKSEGSQLKPEALALLGGPAVVQPPQTNTRNVTSQQSPVSQDFKPAQWFQPAASARAYETYGFTGPKLALVAQGSQNPFSNLRVPVEDFGFPEFGAMANGGLAVSSVKSLLPLVQLLLLRGTQNG